MSGLEAFLASRASFALAAFAVSWIAVVLLALVAANLHFRLAHLERSLPAGEARSAYAHLLGRTLADVLGPRLPSATRLALVLSRDCPSCERILAALRDGDRGRPVALLWRDETPSPRPPLPAGATVLADGPRISRALGVGVSPFAFVADADGRIVRAKPVGSVEALDELLGDDGVETSARRSTTSLSQQPLKGVS